VEVVELLLEHGANVNEQWPLGNRTTPLHVACVAAEPSVALVQLLLDRGASPTATTVRTPHTPQPHTRATAHALTTAINPGP
jgi:ankyrin repeat protein